MSHYPQAPQSIGKVLDSGFSLYRAMFKRILPLSFALALLAQLPGLAPYSAAIFGGLPGAAVVLAFVVILGLIIGWIVVYMGLYNGWIVSMDAIAKGNEALTFGAALKAGMPKILSVFGASILFGLAIMAGMILLVIPGLILIVSMSFFYYQILLEDRDAVQALGDSHKLVWGHWWRTTTVMTVGGAIYLVAYVIVFGIGAMLLGTAALEGPSPEQAREGPDAAVLLFVALQVLMNALLLPMWNSIMLVQFRDLQLRKSGSDLAARAAAA
jgi:hypothetical protein